MIFEVSEWVGLEKSGAGEVGRGLQLCLCCWWSRAAHGHVLQILVRARQALGTRLVPSGETNTHLNACC